VLERLRGVGVTGGVPLSTRLVEAFNEGGLNARLYENGGSLKWSKMLTNLLANATSAILDMTPAEIYAHPGLVRLEIQQIREALRVMRGLGFSPVDLPGTPVKMLVWPSFHIDLHQGRGESEVRYLNGAVARHGAASGIPTPVNRQLTEILEKLTQKKIPLDTYRHAPHKLLGVIQSNLV
jgi:2-dehydropantoate 2-reductase